MVSESPKSLSGREMLPAANDVKWNDEKWVDATGRRLISEALDIREASGKTPNYYRARKLLSVFIDNLKARQDAQTGRFENLFLNLFDELPGNEPDEGSLEEKVPVEIDSLRERREQLISELRSKGFEPVYNEYGEIIDARRTNKEITEDVAAMIEETRARLAVEHDQKQSHTETIPDPQTIDAPADQEDDQEQIAKALDVTRKRLSKERKQDGKNNISDNRLIHDKDLPLRRGLLRLAATVATRTQALEKKLSELGPANLARSAYIHTWRYAKDFAESKILRRTLHGASESLTIGTIVGLAALAVLYKNDNIRNELLSWFNYPVDSLPSQPPTVPEKVPILEPIKVPVPVEVPNPPPPKIPEGLPSQTNIPANRIELGKIPMPKEMSHGFHGLVESPEIMKTRAAKLPWAAREQLATALEHTFSESSAWKKLVTGSTSRIGLFPNVGSIDLAALTDPDLAGRTQKYIDSSKDFKLLSSRLKDMGINISDLLSHPAISKK